MILISLTASWIAGTDMPVLLDCSNRGHLSQVCDPLAQEAL